METLSTSRGMSSSIQFDGSGPHLRQTASLTVRMRATKAGEAGAAPAELHTSSGVVKSQPLTLTVKPGHVADSRAQQPQRRQDPFGGLSPFGQDDDNPFDAFTRRPAPSDRDLFLRGELDKREVFQGEQTTLSLWIYARVDLSRVDAVTLPKLDGFWSEDVESPKELTGETRMLDGVPYRAYLLKRLALFPVKSGTREIGAVEADITTGFLFAGRREHRASQPLSLKVKPLPPGRSGGIPAQLGGELDAEHRADRGARRAGDAGDAASDGGRSGQRQGPGGAAAGAPCGAEALRPEHQRQGEHRARSGAGPADAGVPGPGAADRDVRDPVAGPGLLRPRLASVRARPLRRRSPSPWCPGRGAHRWRWRPGR